MQSKDLLIHFADTLEEAYESTLGDLSDDQIHFRPNDHTLCIAFHTWHLLRTKDNILNFVCQNRKPTVWLRQNLHEAWGLPKIDQGNAMSLEEAQAVRVPSAEALRAYARDLHADVMPYLRNCSEDEMDIVTKIVPWGEATRAQQIMQTVVVHGYAHLGQIESLRALQGLPSGSGM